MAQFLKLEILNRIAQIGMMPVFYHADANVACEVALACAAGGATTFEFTNRGDSAIDVFKTMVRVGRERARDLILGAGSITDEPTAALYVAHGANFIVGPSFNPAVARFCNRRKIPYMPGCLTPTEIATAEEAGVDIVKLFPCESVGGPNFVKALLGPSPWTRIMPTGLSVINETTLSEWFSAGIVSFGIGRELIKKEFLAAQDYPAMTRRTQEILEWVRRAKQASAS
jgi:2-dehydro-3-deoxyphosphogluconate aldolase/(4S)-4-hydroxy-2-oxoglutarate aldolase